MCLQLNEKSIQSIRNIYDRIHEPLSKDIYVKRLLYSITGDQAFIKKIVRTTDEGKSFNFKIEQFRHFILFGAGIWGRNILGMYPELDWLFAWDNSPKNSEISGKAYGRDKTTISTKKYDRDYLLQDDTAVVVTSRLYHTQIYEQLVQDGIDPEQIIDAGEMIDAMSVRQYFDLPYLKRKRDEIFVDGGAFDGETSIHFHNVWAGQYKEIIAFEPDASNIERVYKKIKQSPCHDVTVIPFGLWDDNLELCFQSRGNGSSMVCDDGEERIKVAKMDDMISPEKKVSFIKMDLEGAEYPSLCGARNIIEKYHPTLAISLYHKPEDVWELPELILNMWDGYQFYLRHYSIAASETVLYAI